MLSQNKLDRLGELKCRVDLSPEERQEMAELMRRVREERFGKTIADFLLIDDGGGGRLIPCSDAAKKVVPSELAPRDRDQLEVQLRDLEKRGLSVQREKVA